MSEPDTVSIPIDSPLVESLKKDNLYYRNCIDKQNREIEDKDKRIDELKMERANFETELNDLKNKKKNKKSKDKEESQDLKIQLDEAKNRIEQLEELERIRIQKEDFKTASQIPSTPAPISSLTNAWIAGINVFGMSRALGKISFSLTPKTERGKIIFDITEDGQLKNPRPSQ